MTFRGIFDSYGDGDGVFSNPEKGSQIPHGRTTVTLAAAAARSNFLFPACTSPGATAA